MVKVQEKRIFDDNFREEALKRDETRKIIIENYNSIIMDE